MLREPTATPATKRTQRLRGVCEPHVVGEHVECHLGRHLAKPPHQEVRCTHPALDRTEGVHRSVGAYSAAPRFSSPSAWPAARRGLIATLP